MARPESKLVNIIFQEEPRRGKQTVLMAEVDPDAHPDHGLPGDQPGVSLPICLPGGECWGQDLNPSHPICLPGMGCWEPPGGGEVPPEEPITIPATISQVPAGVTPPSAPSPDAVVVIVDLGPDAKSATGRRTTFGWLNPMVTHHQPAEKK